jgi:DNA-binding transcriptional LysR family regulator
LPAFVAAQDPALIPVLPGVARFQRTFWMSMPGDNKHVARMQATWAFLREAVAAKQGLLLPQINTI